MTMVELKCRCGFSELPHVPEICGTEFIPRPDLARACANIVSDGHYCGHRRICHDPVPTVREGEEAK